MKYFAFGAVLFIISFCEKDEVVTASLASLNVGNFIVGAPSIKMGSNATTVVNNNYTQFELVAGIQNIYIYPVGDSAHRYYNVTRPSWNGDVYSLFLAGTPADSIPYGFGKTT